MRETAVLENGSAASPYSVSVGSATTPPRRIHVAASSIASRCGAPGSTNTRRISILHRARDEPGRQRHEGEVGNEDDAQAGAADETGDERAARHADQRGARENAERGAM